MSVQLLAYTKQYNQYMALQTIWKQIIKTD